MSDRAVHPNVVDDVHPHRLRHAAARGARWTVGTQVTAQLLRLVTTLVLARILAPADFGVIAIVTVVLVLLDHFKDLGTGSAVIQRDKLTPELVNSVFWLNVVLGAVLSLGLLLCAVPTAELLGQPSAAPVLMVMAAVTLTNAFGQVPQALLRRTMRFHALGMADVANAVVASAVSVGLAIAGLGVWSIAIGTVLGTLVGTVWSGLAAHWMPGVHVSLAALRSIWSFSVNLFLGNIAWFVVLGQADKFVIGRWLGLAALGTYALAQRMVTYPVSSIAGMVGQVLYPSLSRSQNDSRAMGDVFVRVSAVVALFLLPLMAGLAVVASPAVDLLLGQQWSHLPPLIWVLAPAGAIQALGALSFHLTTAKGRSDLTLKWQLVQCVCFVAAFVVGLPWGVFGVSAAYAITVFILAPIGLLIGFRLIGLPLTGYLRRLAPIVLNTVVMASCAAVVLVLVGDRSPGLQIAAATVTGLVVYGLGLVVLRPGALADTRVVLHRGV